MPELPEVETVRRGLEKLVVGRVITKVKILNEKSFQASNADVKNFVVGAKIVAARRRAKVLILDLDDDFSLVIHLKMTGQIVFRDDDENWGAGHPTNSFVADLPDKSTRVEFELGEPFRETVFSEPDLPPKNVIRDFPPAEPSQGDEPVGENRNIHFSSANLENGSEKSFAKLPHSSAKTADNSAPKSAAKLFFNDQRKFGWIKLVPTRDVANLDFIKKLGPEMADFSEKNGGDFDAKSAQKLFIKNVRKHAGAPIKAVILNQQVVAGIGNIYADEALWGAKIYPAEPVKNLSDNQLKKIFREAVAAMEKSLAAGGSTMKNYVRADGSRGDYLEKFANVFRREGQPCPRCGTEIIKIRVAGRGTHICPKCQKLKEAA